MLTVKEVSNTAPVLDSTPFTSVQPISLWSI